MFVEAVLTERHRRRGQAAAHRPQPQRPGGPGPPPVPRGRRCGKVRTQLLGARCAVLRRQGGGQHATPSCPATPTCSGPSPSPSPTTCWPTRSMFCRDIDPPGGLPVKRMNECPLGGRRPGRHHLSHRPADDRRRALGFDGPLPQQPGRRLRPGLLRGAAVGPAPP